MEIAPALLTFGLNVLTATLALGISWGVYKTKIAVMLKDYSNLLSKYDKLEEAVLNNAEESTEARNNLDRALNKKIDDSFKEYNKCIHDSLKELEKGAWVIENRCAAREVYINSIPHLTEDINKIRIEVNALPSKLSHELTKTFSEEYQKIIAVIVNKGK